MSTSIGRKVAMALSALFLIVFLLQHLTINLMSVFSAEMFNEVSHFMGHNPVVQFVLQPVLIFGVLFHFIWGTVLQLQNNKARSVNYANYDGSANGSWMSRNMIWTGLAILGFILLHFYDFWIHEMNVKYVNVQPENPTRYFGELQHKFVDGWRVALYVISLLAPAVGILNCSRNWAMPTRYLCPWASFLSPYSIFSNKLDPFSFKRITT